ncbi:MAG: DUF58 domain-containing protein [Thermoplasmata archaeon]|nr:DUF58 domain-containing protein [Thermoplasmata archaeon]
MSDPTGAAEDGPPLHWTPRAVLLVAAVGVFVTLAIVLRSGVPLILAAPLLVAPAAAGLLAPRRSVSGRLTWSAEGSRAEVDVRGRIEWDHLKAAQVRLSVLPAPPLLLEAPIEIQPEGRVLEFHLQYRSPIPCALSLPLLRASWRDPFGLLETEIPLDGEPLPVDRFPPEIQNLGGIKLRHTTPLPGENVSRAIGASGEFFGVRPAVPSDPARRLNWRATARAGRPLVNEFRIERTGDVLLLIDARPTSAGPSRDAELLALSRVAVTGIADRVLDSKSRVGVGLFGEFLDAVPLGTGRRHRFRIRDQLARATVSSVAGPAERLAVSLRRHFPPGVLTILLSPMIDEDQLPVLLHLRRRGFPVVVLSPSAIPLLVPADRTDREDVLSRRLLQLQRDRRLRQVWTEAPVVDWADYWSLAGMVALLERPDPRRRAS